MTSFSFETRVGKKGLIRVPQLAKLENKKIRIKFDIEDVEEEKSQKTGLDHDNSPYVTKEQALAFLSEGKENMHSGQQDNIQVINEINRIVEQIKAKGNTRFLTIEEMNEYEHQQIMKGIQL